MTWPLRCLVVIALVATALANTARAERAASGQVVDDATGVGLAAATVVIGDAQAETDADGRFVIDTLPLGRLEVIVVAEGYAPYFGSARIGDTLAIRLSADAARPDSEVIEVSGRAPTGPPLRLSTAEIRALPGAGNDALRALQSMPGVARAPFGLGGLALRGTAPRDTNVYLDGIEVPLLYHFGGLASFVPTAAVDEISLQPGGASTRYGRGLGGVAVITSRAGRGDRWRTGGELSLIHAAAVAEGPGPARGSWLLGVRRSYFDAIVAAANLDLSLAPRYLDAQARWQSGDGRWMAIVFASDDKLRLIRDPDDPSAGGIDTSNVKSFSYASRFARLGLRYRAVRGATSFSIVPSVGIDDVNGRANHNDIDKGLHRWMVPVSLRAELATPAAGGTLSLGVDGGLARHGYTLLNTPPPSPADPSPDMPIERGLTRWSGDAGVWLEQSWFAARDRLEIRPGLRADYMGLAEQATIDPRLVAIERLGHGIELEQAIGLYHSPPLVTDLDPIFGDRVMRGSTALQGSIGAKAVVGDATELSATAYYQDLRQLPVDAISNATPISDNGGTESGGLLGISRELVDEQFGSYSYREAIGTGHAYGLELIARRSAGPWTGWLAYTYGRSMRRNPSRGDVLLPYVLDQPHSATAVGAVTLGRWRLGGRFRFTTGNPYTPVAGTTVDADGDVVPIDGPTLSARLPAFWQLDLRADRVWTRPWGTLSLYLDVQNVSNRANAEGVTYDETYTMRSYTRGLPVFPSLGLEYIP
jgi:hypothetical protein